MFANVPSIGTLAQQPAVPAVRRSPIPHAPVWFERVPGNGDRFLGRSGNQRVAISASGATIAIVDKSTSSSLHMSMRGADAHANIQASDPLPSYTNYLIGASKEWRTRVPQFGSVRVQNIYPGIDLVYYGRDGRIEYDFVVKPGADPSQIDIAYSGARAIDKDSQGDLHFRLAGTDIVQHRPRVIQNIDGREVEIAASYRVSKSRVRIALASYDRSRDLVIDPILSYSEYIGGTGYDAAIAVAVDAAGNRYVTGTTGTNTIISQSQFQNQFGGATDAFIAKYNASGTLSYFTYLGGEGNDTGRSIAVDSGGNIYVAGDTASIKFPVTQGTPQSRNNGGSADAFVTKIAPAGDNLVYSTFIGGGSDEFGNGLAVDGQGSAYVTGYTRSTDFPTTANAFMQKTKNGGESVFVTKINPQGTAFVYSTVIEGKKPGDHESGEGIAIDGLGNAYVTGYTNAPDFPVVNPIQRSDATGFEDAFVLKLAPDGHSLVYSTYLGGIFDDEGYRIALGADNSAYVVGNTSSIDFPLQAPAQSHFGGGVWDAFVAHISADGQHLLYSTYFGGSGDDFAFADLAVTNDGTVYFGGYTNSSDLLTKNASQASYGGGSEDGFVASLLPSGAGFGFITYFGGSDRDEIHGLAYDPLRSILSVVGLTASSDLPNARNSYVGDATQRVDGFLAAFTSLTVNAGSISTGTPTVTFPSLLANGAPASQTINLTTTTGGTIPFNVTITPASQWLSVTPLNGNAPGQITITADPQTLGAGSYTGTVVIDAGGGNKLSIPVAITVGGAPSITSITPSPLPVGSGNTTITVNGSGFSNASTVTVNGTAIQTTFVSNTTITAQVPATFLANAGSLSLTVNNGTASVSAPFNLSVAAGTPAINDGGIVNAASYRLGAGIAPGEIITVFGSGFGPATLVAAKLDANGNISSNLSGTQLLIGGTPAPLLYAVQGQLSAIVPYSIYGSSTVPVQIVSSGQSSTPVVVNVAGASPGIFTSQANGSGQAVVINSDNSINSPQNPAARGSVITFYVTGEGQTNPAGQEGTFAKGPVYPKPLLPVTVKVSGIDAKVQYAGAAPNFAEGLMQVNAQIPADAPIGTNIPLVVLVGGTASPLNVTVSVK